MKQIQTMCAVATLMTAAIILSGCTTQRLNKEGMDLIEAGQYEEGLAKMEAAMKSDPSDLQLRARFLMTRTDIANRLSLQASIERANGKPDAAEATYRRAMRLDPSSDVARLGLDSVLRDRRSSRVIDQAAADAQAGELDKALALLNSIVSENPTNPELARLKRNIEEKMTRQAFQPLSLSNFYKNPINLEFRDANLKFVFEALSRTTGINFIFDKDVKPDLKTTVFLKNASLEEAVDLVLATNQLEKKVLGENSVLIYPNTPVKAKEYRDLVIRSFFLENADAVRTAAMIKTLLKTSDIFIDEKLNLVIIRDTPEAILLAEKLVAVQDLGEPEVNMEVEVLEIKRTRLQDLGILPSNQMTLTPLPSAGTTLTLNDLRNLSSSTIGVSIAPTIINLKREAGTVNLLANPRIRARNREKAKILIGDKVPVITSTSTATGFVAESVQYLDVGLKLEVEPNVYLRDDIAIKVALEVSNIVAAVKTNTGTLTYQIGTRNANTVLRLRDGETQILAGLISDEDRRTNSGIPGLADLPIAGRLFSSQRDDRQKTEIVLSITPRLVRNIRRPEAVAEYLWSGSEASMRTRPLAVQGQRPQVALAPTTSPGQSAPQASAAPLPATVANAGGAIGLVLDGPAQVKVGQPFEMTVRIRAQSPIRGLPSQLAFDPKALKVVDVKEGSFFAQGGAPSNFSSNTDDANGRLFIGAVRGGGSATEGDGVVAVVRFLPLSPQAGTQISVIAMTPVAGGDNIPSTAQTAPLAITITP